MVDSAQDAPVSYSVVINPDNGPGNAPQEAYTNGINDLINAGVEVLCYVATGFGRTRIREVLADLDDYASFYPGLCGGIFFDEGPGTESFAYKYIEYYSYVQEVCGPGSTVVVNPGVPPHESLYNIGDLYAAANPGQGGRVVIVSYENVYDKFCDDDEGAPVLPSPPRDLQDGYMHSILVYGAFFSSMEEYLDMTMYQLYCANWGYVYFTDDVVADDCNPWDEVPSYFTRLLEAAGRASNMAGGCETWAPTPTPTVATTVAPLTPQVLGATGAPVHTPGPSAIVAAAQPGATPGPTPGPTPPLYTVCLAPLPITPMSTSGAVTSSRREAALCAGAIAAGAAAAALCYGLPS